MAQNEKTGGSKANDQGDNAGTQGDDKGSKGGPPPASSEKPAEAWKPAKGASVEVFVPFQGPYPKRCSGVVLEVEKSGRIKARVTMPNGDAREVQATPRNRFGVGYAAPGSR